MTAAHRSGRTTEGERLAREMAVNDAVPPTPKTTGRRTRASDRAAAAAAGPTAEDVQEASRVPLPKSTVKKGKGGYYPALIHLTYTLTRHIRSGATNNHASSISPARHDMQPCTARPHAHLSCPAVASRTDNHSSLCCVELYCAMQLPLPHPRALLRAPSGALTLMGTMTRIQRRAARGARGWAQPHGAPRHLGRRL